MEMKPFTADTSVADVVRQCPSARRIFDQHGLRGCGGEHGPAESLTFFAGVHQVDLDQLLCELNAELRHPSPAYRYHESLEDFIYRRFFKAGILIAITLGVLWGAVNLLQIALRGSFLQLSLVPAIHAHAHAMVYGWVGLFVMGFAYQSFPRFKNTKLWRPGLANLSFCLMLSGIGARVVAELLQPAQLGLALGVFAAAAELLAIALFVLILYRTARQSIEPPSKYEKFIFGSLFWLAVGALLSQVFFFAKAFSGTEGELIMRIATLDGPLRDIQLAGFALLIIAGVSQRFVPMVYGLARPRSDRQTLIFVLINVSLVLNVCSYIGLLTTNNPVFAIGLEAAYLLMPVWAVLLVRQLGIFSRPSQPDRTYKFIHAAYGWLLVSCFMMPFFLFYSSFTGQPFAHAYLGAQRHAFTVGFVSFMILGVAGRVTPILAGVDGNHFSRLWVPFVLFNLGCTARVVLQIATDFTARAYPLLGMTGFVELVALTWWGVEVWRIMNLARGRRNQGFGQFTQPGPTGKSAPMITIAPAS
jgi:hypothetical protein